MAQHNQITTGKLFSPSVGRIMITGWAIALTLIVLFLLAADKADANWPKYWILKPLIITPIAGACGGLFFDFMNQLTRSTGGWKRALSLSIGILGFIVSLWLGSVLGLAEYYWH